ncbi:hypothetical protein ACFWDA_25285 [Rhodococcus zopfii]|uniref:hypothetical protein n=1 Tax=Rhodococcus zopfii TaxID=43772 RepID=UPI003660640C
MRGILGELLNQKIPARIHTSDGNEYYGLVIGVPSVVAGPGYDYVVVDEAMSILNDVETKRARYIALPYVVSVVPDREPTLVERDEHGDPIVED